MDALPENSTAAPSSLSLPHAKRGQPTKYENPMVTRTFRFPEFQIDWLEQQAGIHGDTSTVLRSLVAAAMWGADQTE